MKKIRDIISKPSEALRAMVDGLLEQSQRKDFVINMSDWGSTNGKVCFGCAATCTIQKLAGKDLEPVMDDEIISSVDWRAKSLDLDNSSGDVNQFENAINNARSGDLEGLFDFFYINHHHIDTGVDWDLGTDNWKEQLPEVERIIKYLIAQGV